MLLRQLINPVYIVRRARLALWETKYPDRPWIAAQAVEILDHYLASNHIALEYGSGRSTAWIAKRVQRLVSVEADLGWHQIVTEQLQRANISNVDLRLCPLEHGINDLWHRTYNPTPKYVAAANSFEDASLDFCLVDGQYREACIAAVASKLKPGGLLVLDNLNWHSLEHWAIPEEFRLISADANAKTQTGVFVRTLGS
jgi:predicted O-methyltransferase YrrM